MKKKNTLVITLFVLILFLAACKDSVTQDNLIINEANSETDECVRVKEESGVDIAFVLDSSGSMQKNDIGDLRIEKAKVVVEEMVNKDRALVISFDKEAKLITGHLTDNQEIIISALNKIPSDQKYTNLANGLSLAINQFEKDENQNQKIIIALTDGENAGETDAITEKINQDTYNYALTASNKNITIYTIGLGNGVDEELLKNVASTTGGKYFHTADNFGLEEVYRDVTEELKCLPMEKNEQENEKYVIFEDNDLKQFINTLLGFESSYNPTEEDLLNVTDISFENLDANSISSLEGLQHAVNLETIILHNQSISDFSPLISLSNLKKLDYNNDLGLINLLTNEEKQLYANYLVEKLNKETTLELLNGNILDANKDGRTDVVLIYSEQCEFPNHDCIYIEILTNDSGTLKVLHDTKQYSNDAQNHIFYVGGDIAFNSVYINNTSNNFELIIMTNGGSSANHGEYYQNISLNNSQEFSYTATNLYASYCPPGDEECKDITEFKEVKGNMDIEYIQNLIKNGKMIISFEEESLFFNQLYSFGTVQLVVEENLTPKEGLLLSYEPSFTEEKGTFNVQKEDESIILLMPGSDMPSYNYYQDDNYLGLGVYATDWILFNFEYSKIGNGTIAEDEIGFDMFPPEFGYLEKISTDEILTVKAGKFNNVTIFHTNEGNRIYIAPGYGVIKIESDMGEVLTALIEVK